MPLPFTKLPPSIRDDEHLTLAQATTIIPGRPHINTVRRWCDRGFRGIKLRSWRCAGRRLTSVPAIDEFLAATTGVASQADPATKASHLEAEAALDDMGVT